tara:strand:- start:122 stop:382 length:261 start_codon:yes stop_codon:yes gene_type:complete
MFGHTAFMTNHYQVLSVSRKEKSPAKGKGRNNLAYTQHTNRKYKRGDKMEQNRFVSAIVEKEIYLWDLIWEVSPYFLYFNLSQRLI